MFDFMFGPVYHSPLGYPGPSKTDIRLSVSESLDPIEKRIESLERASLALWSLLKEKTGATDEELIAEIQKRKTVEEQHSDAPVDCPSCGRHLLVRHSPKCSWCGAELNHGPF